MAALPSLFVSHGAPTLIIDPVPARDFLANLGKMLPRPDAILIASAHWQASGPRISAVPVNDTIHDFGGFPDELYQLTYPAKGSPALAERAAALLRQAGLNPVIDDKRGLDHGAWVPLKLAFPDADIPVTGISLLAGAGPAEHLAIGKALAPLRQENILLIGSGSLTHNLAEVFQPSMAAHPDWAQDFEAWVFDKITTGDTADLAEYRTRAPHGRHSHPTDEHFLPLFVALGAATPGVPGRRLHQSMTFRSLAMNAYAFD